MSELFQGLIALAVIVGGGLIIYAKPEQSAYVIPFMAAVIGFFFGSKTVANASFTAPPPGYSPQVATPASQPILSQPTTPPAKEG